MLCCCPGRLQRPIRCLSCLASPTPFCSSYKSALTRRSTGIRGCSPSMNCAPSSIRVVRRAPQREAVSGKIQFTKNTKRTFWSTKNYVCLLRTCLQCVSAEQSQWKIVAAKKRDPGPPTNICPASLMASDMCFQKSSSPCQSVQLRYPNVFCMCTMFYLCFDNDVL